MLIRVKDNKYFLILSELLELVLNYFIYQSSDRLLLIQPLYGKTLKIDFLEFQYSLILYFDENQVFIFNEWIGLFHCIIKIRLKDLFLYTFETCMKKNDYSIPLEIKGDLRTTQDLIKLIHEIRLFLSFFSCSNSVIFEGIYFFKKYFFNFFQKKINFIKLCLGLAISDEWKLIPNSIELLWFYKDVYNLKIRMEFLSKRLKFLEKYNGF